jgi:hypothetical protein
VRSFVHQRVDNRFASHRRLAVAAFLVLTPALTVGCAWRHQTSRTYAPGFEPIRERTESAMPSDNAAQPNVQSGQEEGVYWADARMIVRASAADVCDALKRPEVVVNDAAVDTWRVSPLDLSPVREGVTGFVLVNTVHRVATITFQIAWQFAESEEDEGCVARWDLTRAPAFIAKNRGWVLVEPLDDELTLIEAQAELKAPRVDASVPHGYLTLLVEKVVLASFED